MKRWYRMCLCRPIHHVVGLSRDSFPRQPLTFSCKHVYMYRLMGARQVATYSARWSRWSQWSRTRQPRYDTVLMIVMVAKTGVIMPYITYRRVITIISPPFAKMDGKTMVLLIFPTWNSCTNLRFAPQWVLRRIGKDSARLTRSLARSRPRLQYVVAHCDLATTALVHLCS